MKKIFLLSGLIVFFLISCSPSIGNKISVTTLIKDTKSWNGAELPKYLNGNPEVTILKIVIPPKTKLPLHEHPVINAGVLLKGKLRVVSNKDTLHLNAGDPIVELVNTWHYGENLENKPAEIIVFYAGIKGEPITVLKEGEGH